MSGDAGLRLVAIGASAGGVDAVGELLAGLPAGFDIPVVVVLHVPPGRSSQLAEVFSLRSTLRVREAADKMPLAPGTVLVAPPDYHLLVERDETVSLSSEEAVMFSRPSIDLLFESIAWSLGAAALGIVLTGANDDGARGLALLRAAGGTAWVQAPDDAQVSTMPQAALERAGADATLPLARMKDALSRLRRGSPAAAALSPG